MTRHLIIGFVMERLVVLKEDTGGPCFCIVAQWSMLQIQIVTLQPILHIKDELCYCLKGLSIESCLEISAWQLDLPMKLFNSSMLPNQFWKLDILLLIVVSWISLFLVGYELSAIKMCSCHKPITSYTVYLVQMKFEPQILPHAGMLYSWSEYIIHGCCKAILCPFLNNLFCPHHHSQHQYAAYDGWRTDIIRCICPALGHLHI